MGETGCPFNYPCSLGVLPGVNDDTENKRQKRQVPSVPKVVGHHPRVMSKSSQLFLF